MNFLIVVLSILSLRASSALALQANADVASNILNSEYQIGFGHSDFDLVFSRGLRIPLMSPNAYYKRLTLRIDWLGLLTEEGKDAMKRQGLQLYTETGYVNYQTQVWKRSSSCSSCGPHGWDAYTTYEGADVTLGLGYIASGGFTLGCDLFSRMIPTQQSFRSAVHNPLDFSEATREQAKIDSQISSLYYRVLVFRFGYLLQF